jgi:hypothetical protein
LALHLPVPLLYYQNHLHAIGQATCGFKVKLFCCLKAGWYGGGFNVVAYAFGWSWWGAGTSGGICTIWLAGNVSLEARLMAWSKPYLQGSHVLPEAPVVS